MAGISAGWSARGVGIGSKPFSVKACPRRRDGRCAARLEGRVRDAPDVPKLEHDVAASDIDRFRYAFPAFDLLGAVDSWGRDVALTLRRDLGRFRNDEAGASALGIVEGIQLVWHVPGTGTTARQRCHDDAVPEHQWSNFDRAEEIGGVIRISFLHG